MTMTSERLQLKITLANIEPKIWRQVVVKDSLTFRQLHSVIQRAMGWEDYHLHEFKVGDIRVGTRIKEDMFGFGDSDMVSESTAQLHQLLIGKRKFRYWYDFGDDWWHDIAIEKHLPDAADAPPAELLAGENACPPEDCGGPWGYVDMLEALKDPDHPEHDSYSEWAGLFDPKEFDLEAARSDVQKAVRTRRAKVK